jgi:hypothetical protein
MLKNTPNVVIAGTVKSGTTSLFTYLSWHPDVCVSSVKETNYFTPIIYDEKISNLENYYSFFEHCNESLITLEASPRYLYGGRKIAKIIKEVR